MCVGGAVSGCACVLGRGRTAYSRQWEQHVCKLSYGEKHDVFEEFLKGQHDWNLQIITHYVLPVQSFQVF